jgi:hypothetical protein
MVPMMPDRYWTFWADNSDGLEVRHCDIVARRAPNSSTHDAYDLTAFNTDGFDVTGNDVWIHDVNVWNQDDSVCVKDKSTNMLFERINARRVLLLAASPSSPPSCASQRRKRALFPCPLCSVFFACPSPCVRFDPTPVTATRRMPSPLTSTAAGVRPR